MKRNEFEKICKESFPNYKFYEPTDDEYKIIEEVYTWHPAISYSSHVGTREIAEIYMHYGMQLIKDMLPTARKKRSLEEEIVPLRRLIQQHNIEIKKLLDRIDKIEKEE
ncbi:MAG: hypothetical protein J6S49_05095 [Erysipelotrichaceae bacterium]|nr:hypothetical protein [Erysipelotrichaceae bacterium]